MGEWVRGQTEFWAKPVPPKPRRPRAGTAPLPDILLKISRLFLGRTPLSPSLFWNTCLSGIFYSNWLKNARDFAGPGLPGVALAPACGYAGWLNESGPGALTRQAIPVRVFYNSAHRFPWCFYALCQ